MTQEELFNENQKLVDHILHKHFSHCFDMYDDCKQVGLVALFHASRYYNTERGVAFSTYAYPVIKNAIKDYVDEQMKGPTAPIEEAYEVPSNDTSDSYLKREAILEILTEEEKRIVLLKESGYSLKEISIKVHCKVQHLYYKMEKIRTKITNSYLQ